MNEAMKKAWLEITMCYDDATSDDFNAFLLTWQKAIQAEREQCALACERLAPEWADQPGIAQAERATIADCAAAIRARGQA
jgi:hypothetical protein